MGIGGEFWTTENPGVCVRGEFTAKIGERAEATLDGGLTAGLVPGQRPMPAFRPGDMAGAMRAHAASSVARLRAISFQGRLDTGELVTLLDAPYYGGAGLAPLYKAPMWLRNRQTRLIGVGCEGHDLGAVSLVVAAAPSRSLRPVVRSLRLVVRSLRPVG